MDYFILAQIKYDHGACYIAHVLIQKFLSEMAALSQSTVSDNSILSSDTSANEVGFETSHNRSSLAKLNRSLKQGLSPVFKNSKKWKRSKWHYLSILDMYSLFCITYSEYFPKVSIDLIWPSSCHSDGLVSLWLLAYNLSRC